MVRDSTLHPVPGGGVYFAWRLRLFSRARIGTGGSWDGLGHTVSLADPWVAAGRMPRLAANGSARPRPHQTHYSVRPRHVADPGRPAAELCQGDRPNARRLSLVGHRGRTG